MRRLKRAIRKQQSLLAAILLVVAIFASYVWLVPWIQSLLPGSGPAENDIVRLGSGEQNLSRLMTAIFTFWFFFVGATIGSFLNVVVYRMPLGKSVVFQPSHCPFCKDKIKAYHNIPIFGWLSLNGRCRKCRLPISARYPSVELVCGLIFLTIFFVELCSGGWNLPVRELNEKTGVVRTVFDPKWDLIAISAFHLYLFCALLTGSLIHWDRQRIPARFWMTSLVIAIVSSMALSQELCLQNWEWPFLSEYLIAPGYLQGLAICLIGGLVGSVLGFICHGIVGQAKLEKANLILPNGIPIVLGLAGAFLGWQAALSIAILGLIMALVAIPILKSDQKTALPWLMVFSIATFLHHLVWRIEYNLIQPFAENQIILFKLGLILAMVGLAFLVRLLNRKDADLLVTEG